MTASDEPRNSTFDRLRTEVVTKPDGRYVIYYSWPDDDPAAGEPSGGQPAAAGLRDAPGQAPWSPEAGPPDV